MKRKIYAATVVLASSTNAYAGEKAVILKQTGVPLSISAYSVKFEPEEGSSGYTTRHPDQITHTVNYTNISQKEIVAIQIGFAAFDAFNTFMDRFSGWSIATIQPGDTRGGVWTQKPYAAFSFKEYGTGISYISAVRFSDGAIWRANLSEVLTEMQKFEKDLKKEDLMEKKK